MQRLIPVYLSALMVLFFSANASAFGFKDDKPLPFGEGIVDLGGIVGIGGGSNSGVSFTLGVNGGYLVIDALEVGLQTDVTFGSVDTQWVVLPYLRWMPARSLKFTPYLQGSLGALFGFVGEEIFSVGVMGIGGGFLISLGGRVYLDFKIHGLRMLKSSGCINDDCNIYRGGISLNFFFGGGHSDSMRAPFFQKEQELRPIGE